MFGKKKELVSIHNPKVRGSNPSPVTIDQTRIFSISPHEGGLFLFYCLYLDYIFKLNTDCIDNNTFKESSEI